MAPETSGGCVEASWARLRLPWLLAAALLCLLGFLLAWRLPLRADPSRPAAAWSWAWWKEPQEQNAFARLPVLQMEVLKAALSTDGHTALAVGGSMILRSEDAGRSWSQVASPSKKNLFGVALAADGRTALAVGDNGTILRSEDAGRSWSQAAAPSQDEGLDAVALAADGHTALAISWNGTILRSEDAGKTWTQTTAPSKETFSGLALAADGRTALAVGWNGTILRSEDAGRTWTQAAAPIKARLRGAALSADGRTALAVGGGCTILRSEDAGRSWSQVTSPSEDEGLDAVALAADGRTALAAGTVFGTMFTVDGRTVLTPGWYSTILRSEDAGKSWSKTVTLGQELGEERFTDVALAADGRAALAASNVGVLLLSENAGRTWSQVTAPAGQIMTGAGVALAADGRSALTIARHDMVLRSEDADKSWSQTIVPNKEPLHSFALAADGRVVLALGRGGTLLRSEDAGRSWSQAVAPSKETLSDVALAADGRTALALVWNGAILRSEDTGRSWSHVAAPSEGYFSGVALAADGRTALAVGGSTILRSEDAGMSWSHVAAPSKESLEAVALAADGRTALAIGRNSTILRSGDEGRSWSQVASPSSEELWGVALAADGRIALAVGDDDTILRSEDAGRSWSHVATPSRETLGAVALAADGRTALAVSLNGTILHSADGGRSWQVVMLHRRWPAPIAWLLWFAALAMLLPALQPLPPPRRCIESLARLFTPDRPLGDADVAGAGALAAQLSHFLRSVQTEPPLTVAVTGSWGSGKSSVLELLRRDLERRSIRPVCFNAWHHRKEESISAALLQEVREQAVPPLLSPVGVSVRIRSFSRRVAMNPLPWLCGLAFLCFISAAWPCFVGAQMIEQTLKVLPSPSFLGVGGMLLAVWSIARGFRVSLESRGLDPDGQLAFRARFAEAFEEVTLALGKHRLSIIIDDLDRCRPDQIAELMEAINFLTNAGDCFAILAVDRKQALNGIGLAYAAMAKENAPVTMDDREARARYAEHFLRKIIQMEVRAPIFDAEAAGRLVEAMERIPEQETQVFDRSWRRAAIAGVVALLALGGYIGGDVLRRQALSAPSTSAPSLLAVLPLVAPALDQAPSSLIGLQQAPMPAPSAQDRVSFVSRPPAPALTLNLGFWGLALPLTLVAGLGVWLRRSRRSLPAVESDSETFAQALKAWTPAAFKASPSPREFKRFLNRLRFVASVEQAEGAVPEPTLVGLGTLASLDARMLHDLAGADLMAEIRRRAAEDSSSKKQEAYRAALEAAEKVGFEPSKAEIERFIKAWAGVN